MKTTEFILALIILIAGYYTHIHHKLPHGKDFGEKEKLRAEDDVAALTQIEEGGEIKIEGQL